MVFRTFTETIDLNTETGGPSILGLHTPIGGDAYKFLQPFFQAYKKYKYLGMDVTIVNSARLPYDPEQMGKVAGTNYVDPRDSLNPVLFKGCHGEHLGTILNSMYGGMTSDVFKDSSLDKEVVNAAFENFYYTALGDDSWRKSPIQKTLHIKGLHPITYQVAINGQIMPTGGLAPSGYAENVSAYDSSSGGTSQPGSLSRNITESQRAPTLSPTYQFDPSIPLDATNSFKYRFQNSFFTNGVKRLGWIDTLQLIGQNNADFGFNVNQIALLPKIFMGLLVLPKANLCRNYLRIIISHKFKFSGYRTITTGGVGNGVASWYTTALGYHDRTTGNTSKEVRDLEDNVDYDAIEEVDEDGTDTE